MATKNKTATPKPGIDTTKGAKFKTVTTRTVEAISPKGIYVPGYGNDDHSRDDRAAKAARREAPHFSEALLALYKENDPKKLPPPVVVTVDGHGRLRVLDGGRRIVHADMAGAAQIEYIVADSASPADEFIAVRAANLGRVDDGPLTIARDCVKAREEYGIIVEDYARRATNLQPEVLRQRLSLLYLAPEFQAMVELPESDDNYLPFSVGIQLSKILKPATDKAAKAETQEARELRFHEQRKAYAKAVESGTLNAKGLQREKAARNAAAKAGDAPAGAAEGDGSGAEGDGSDASGDADKKGRQRSANAWTLKEIRAAVAAYDLKGPEFTDMKPATVNVFRALLGLGKPEAIPGFIRAQNALRGVTPEAVTAEPAKTADVPAPTPETAAAAE